MSKSELVALCPIDGVLGRGHTPRTVSVASLRGSATELAAVLRSAHDPGWAKYFERALEARDDQRFMTLMGHSLAVLVRRGPVRDLMVTRNELEQLLVDTVAQWPPRPRRSAPS